MRINVFGPIKNGLSEKDENQPKNRDEIQKLKENNLFSKQIYSIRAAEVKIFRISESY